jgi:tetratricopeptide (TPR) repeat protein
MAKQRQQPKSKPQENSTRSRSARQAQPQAPPSPGPAVPLHSNNPPAPARRSTYVDAVSLYEKGLEALQRHDYEAAIGFLQSVLTSYPEEKELQERVRLYLNVCQRQAAARQATPTTVSERLFAATLAINGERYDEALKHLRLVRDEDPDNDHALYMLAVAHTQRGEFADLEPLREDDAFRAALEAPPSPRPLDRRRPLKGKSGQ